MEKLNNIQDRTYERKEYLSENKFYNFTYNIHLYKYNYFYINLCTNTT